MRFSIRHLCSLWNSVAKWSGFFSLNYKKAFPSMYFLPQLCNKTSWQVNKNNIQYFSSTNTHPLCQLPKECYKASNQASAALPGSPTGADWEFEPKQCEFLGQLKVCTNFFCQEKNKPTQEQALHRGFLGIFLKKMRGEQTTRQCCSTAMHYSYLLNNHILE